MATQSPPSADVLVATATAFLRVFTTMDPETITNVQTENYKHEFAPASLGVPDPFNKQTFAAHLRHLAGVLKSFPVRPLMVWPNPSLKQVVIWSDSETEFHDQFKDTNDDKEWNYKGEYIWVLTMDDSGGKVQEVLEFLDSKGTEALRGLVARAFKKREQVLGRSEEHVKGGWEY